MLADIAFRPLRVRALIAIGCVVFGAWASAGCGGGARKKPPRTAEDGDEFSETEGDEDVGDEHSAGEPSASECSDGTCFECGRGMCPTGFYCDQDAAGGAACSWLPECAKDPSCACVERALGASCSCSSSAGGPSVSCQ